jgi:hypothetical protein
MGTVGPYLVAGLTVLLVISLAGVIASSPQPAVRSDPSGPDSLAADQPEAIADPASHGDRQLVTPNGADPPRVAGRPPWASAPRPPDRL